MATLDSPLEALAFEYVRFGVLAVVNNDWTWIAIVTAAVNFWRIRITIVGDDVVHGCSLLEELTASKSKHKSGHLEPQAMAGPVEETAAPRVKEAVVAKAEVCEPLMCCDGITKGKLVMYYEADIDGGRGVKGDGELTPAVNSGGGLGDCGEWWEIHNCVNSDNT